MAVIQDISAALNRSPVTSLSVETTRFNKAGEIEATTLDEYAEGDQVVAFINQVPVATGEVTEAKDNSDGSYEIVANDVTFKMKNTTVTEAFQKIGVGEIARKALNKVESPNTIDVPSNLVTSAEYTNAKVADIVEKMAKIGNKDWWVTPQGELKIADYQSSEYQLENVVEATAGKKLPPYRKVVVYGESPTSELGIPTIHLLKKGEVKGTVGQGEPVFQHKDRTVKSQQEADNMAEKLLKEFKRRRAEGYVKIVGRAEIRPLDIVKMPSHLGGERYLVDRIKHVVDASNGFTTEIRCGAPIDAS